VENDRIAMAELAAAIGWPRRAGSARALGLLRRRAADLVHIDAPGQGNLAPRWFVTRSELERVLRELRTQLLANVAEVDRAIAAFGMSTAAPGGPS
jgi:hypothetical protein